jgi:ribulose-5-phosphate 4-epimerase/fuculose-1-phosphate aldolase
VPASSWLACWAIAPPACRIEVLEVPPEHVGLGAGTQLALSVVAGLTAYRGHDPLEESGQVTAGLAGTGTAIPHQVPGRRDRFLLAPFGLLWSEVRASDFMEIDFAGQAMAGSGLVEPTALHIHLAVHRRVPQAACVLHTHMPYATALGMLEEPRLQMAGQNALGFHNDIAYADYRGLALDHTEGEREAEGDDSPIGRKK